MGIERIRRLLLELTAEIEALYAEKVVDGYDDTPLASLRPREQEVARFLLAGRSAREISIALDINLRTVENHVANIYKAFGVRGRYELISLMREKASPPSNGSDSGS